MSIFAKKTTKYKAIDDLWALLVKILAGRKCEYCGSTQSLNSHHIFSSKNLSIRWNEINGICLCAKHHSLSSDFSAHLTPLTFSDWIQEKRGEDWYLKLLLCKQQIGKPDIEGQKLYLRQEIKRHET